MKETEYFWDDLLQFIEERAVIPIVGQELLTVEVEGTQVSLYQHLAGQLADTLAVPRAELPAALTINQVVYRYLQMPGSRREQLYRRMRAILNESVLPVPAPLQQLAAITHFNCFVTTTVDALLEKAVNEVRFGGNPKAASVVYTLNDVKDLPCEIAQLKAPAVFYLFGRATSQPNYVLTEEDTLEFVHSLQSDARRPQLLFDELRSKHLLLIGNSHSDWLSRFFIRTLRNERLTNPGDREAIVAGEEARRDGNLILFLHSPLSYGTRVYEAGSAVEFVAELSTRWSERNPPVKEGPEDNPVQVVEAAAAEMAPGSIFLSYASEDVEVATKLKDLLEEQGLEVWFDKRRLEGGDDYDQKIRRNINRCSLFMPLISAHTEQRMEGYFRREWRYALDRAMNMDDSVAFVVPVVAGKVPVDTAHVPDTFKKLHWMKLEEGRLSEEEVQRLVQRMREYRRQERGYQ